MAPSEIADHLNNHILGKNITVTRGNNNETGGEEHHYSEITNSLLAANISLTTSEIGKKQRTQWLDVEILKVKDNEV